MASYLDLECDLSDSFDQAEGILSSNMLKLDSFKNAESKKYPLLIRTLNSRYRSSLFKTKETLDRPSQISKESYSEESKVCLGNKGLQISSTLPKNVTDPESYKNLQSSSSGLLHFNTKTLDGRKKSKETRYRIKEDLFGKVKAEKLSDESTEPDIEIKKERLKLKKQYLADYSNKSKKWQNQLLIPGIPSKEEKISLFRTEDQTLVLTSRASKKLRRLEKKEELVDNCGEKDEKCWEKTLPFCKLPSLSEPNTPRAPKSSLRNSRNNSRKRISLISPGPQKVTISKAADEVRIIPTQNKDFRREIAQLKRDKYHLDFILIGILPHLLLEICPA